VSSSAEKICRVSTDPSALRRRAPLAWLVIRVAAPLAYALAATADFVAHGIPLERGRLGVWILGALLCLSLGNLRSFGRSVVLEWLPLLAALTLYDVVRGAADRGGAHAELQIWIDRHVLGGGVVPTVWLQQHLWDAARLGVPDVASWATYMSYFLLSPLVLAALWLVDRPGFRSYARRLTLLSFGAAALFFLVPSQPPWLASENGLIGPAQRLVGPIGERFPWFDGSSLWERGLSLANSVAAFPSLHEAMTILLVVVLWRRVPRPVRVVLAAYPLAMAFALVYTGEHYVTDLVAGALLTAVVCLVEPPVVRATTRAARAVAAWRPAPSFAAPAVSRLDSSTRSD
jgi:membrane-associated phospholipid phosphatase